MWVEGAGRRTNLLLSNVQFVAAILYVGMLFVSALCRILGHGGERGVRPGRRRSGGGPQFPVYGSALTLVFALRMAAMFVITSSTIGRRSGTLHDGSATYAGYFVGEFLLLSATLERWFALVFPVWLLVLSVILAMRALRIDPELMIVRGDATPSVVIVRDEATEGPEVSRTGDEGTRGP